MSLKAKIEAVIYASEEPVTLAQLVSLLGVEGQAELDALADQQESLPLEESEAESTLNPEALNAETTGEPAEAEPATPESSAPVESVEAAPAVAQAPGIEGAEALAEGAAKETAAAARARERRLRDHFRSILDQLITDYASDERGLEIREVAGGFRFATKP
ncbi:MAG TPA: SMC-Scp complex subunit ScpB, partial [Bryocella sp.]|nr:SMC-Scp complex subunit ScpB [Bryocella sp.]